MVYMRIKAVILLTFLLFFSFANAANAAFTEETRMNSTVESKYSIDQDADDFEMFFDAAAAVDSVVPDSLHASETTITGTRICDIFKPPKTPSFIS